MAALREVEACRRAEPAELELEAGTLPQVARRLSDPALGPLEREFLSTAA